MKYLYSLSIAALFVFSSSLICFGSKADTAKVLLEKEQGILLNARLTYSTVPAFHEKYRATNLDIHYQNISIIHVERLNQLDTQQPLSKGPSTFFEKASLFNDKLQSWLN